MTLTQWYKNYKTLTSVDRYLISEQIKNFKYVPKISLITPVYNTKLEWLHYTYNCVKNQIYSNWEWCICDNGSTQQSVIDFLNKISKSESRIKLSRLENNLGIVGGTNVAIENSTGDYSMFLDSDDEIPETTLYFIAELLNSKKDIKFIYMDQIFMDDDGEYFEVSFKPDWSPEFLRSRNYIDHPRIYLTSLLKELKMIDGYNGSSDYDLLLRTSEVCNPNEIYHIPFIGYSWRKHKLSTSQSNVSWPIAGAIKALEDHLKRINRKAKVFWDWPWYRVKYEVPKPSPSVAIITCSENKNGMLFKFLENLFKKTDYDNYVVYLCCPTKVEKEVFNKFKFFVDQNKLHFVERTDKEPFNFSKFNNRMANIVTEEFICQMNDDIDPMSDSWLSEMVSLAVQDKKIGAVGAKLLYSNTTVQHVGCALGIGGLCDHLFRHIGHNDPGYHGRAKLISNVSMVTAACLLIKTATYKEVGGYEEQLAVAFNDVDFCIKVRDAGYYNVCNPNALLFHYESATRGYDTTPEQIRVQQSEAQFMIKKWGKILQRDPYYNPNLKLEGYNCDIDPNPRIKKPWLQ